MANRGDMQSVFPRHLKRIWTLGKYGDAHEAGEMKRMMISAHANYKAFKNKKRAIESSDKDSEA
jgi:hypothetical protein